MLLSLLPGYTGWQVLFQTSMSLRGLLGGFCSVDVMENGRNAGSKRRQGSVPYPIGNILLRGLLASGASWHMACRQEIGSYLSVSHFPLYLTRHFISFIAREIMGFVSMYGWNSGSTVVKVLRHKSEGRWFDPKWCHWNFSLT